MIYDFRKVTRMEIFMHSLRTSLQISWKNEYNKCLAFTISYKSAFSSTLKLSWLERCTGITEVIGMNPRFNPQ